MNKKKKVVAVSGSTRATSTNLRLIKAIADLTADRFDVTIFGGITEIPHFNPDYDNENPPKEVEEFRNIIRNSDGVLICTPEYAMGVPGTLKNAIDWTVSSMEFSKRPTALITASTLGQKGHASLLETLKIIESSLTDKTQLLISHAKTKIDDDNKITDENTLEEVMILIDDFEKLMEGAGVRL